MRIFGTYPEWDRLPTFELAAGRSFDPVTRLVAHILIQFIEGSRRPLEIIPASGLI
jgi:hypothetical protein